MPDMNTIEVTFDDAPDKIDIDSMVERIMNLSTEKKLRLLKILIEKNYISEADAFGLFRNME